MWRGPEALVLVASVSFQSIDGRRAGRGTGPSVECQAMVDSPVRRRREGHGTTDSIVLYMNLAACRAALSKQRQDKEEIEPCNVQKCLGESCVAAALALEVAACMLPGLSRGW